MRQEMLAFARRGARLKVFGSVCTAYMSDVMDEERGRNIR